MRKSLLSLVVLAALAATAAGCGGSSGGPSGGGGGSGNSSKAADPAKLANCLNNLNWIVAPTGQDVSGNAGTGEGIDIRIMDTPAAAKAAAAKKPKKSTAVVGTAVVQFLGQVSPTGPAPPAPVNQTDLKQIKTCIEQST